MYDTYLGGRVRKYGTYGVGKSVQVVGAGNQYVSYTPRAFKSVRTPIQNEALSDFPSHMPRTSFKPFCFRSTQR